MTRRREVTHRLVWLALTTFWLGCSRDGSSQSGAVAAEAGGHARVDAATASTVADTAAEPTCVCTCPAPVADADANPDTDASTGNDVEDQLDAGDANANPVSDASAVNDVEDQLGACDSGASDADVGWPGIDDNLYSKSSPVFRFNFGWDLGVDAWLAGKKPGGFGEWFGPMRVPEDNNFTGYRVFREGQMLLVGGSWDKNGVLGWTDAGSFYPAESVDDAKAVGFQCWFGPPQGYETESWHDLAGMHLVEPKPNGRVIKLFWNSALSKYSYPYCNLDASEQTINIKIFRIGSIRQVVQPRTKPALLNPVKPDPDGKVSPDLVLLGAGASTMRVGSVQLCGGPVTPIDNVGPAPTWRTRMAAVDMDADGDDEIIVWENLPEKVTEGSWMSGLNDSQKGWEYFYPGTFAKPYAGVRIANCISNDFYGKPSPDKSVVPNATFGHHAKVSRILRGDFYDPAQQIDLAGIPMTTFDPPRGLAAGDVDGDKIGDIIVFAPASEITPTVKALPPDDAMWVLALKKCPAGYCPKGASVALPVPCKLASAATLADLDGDGDLDVAASCFVALSAQPPMLRQALLLLENLGNAKFKVATIAPHLKDNGQIGSWAELGKIFLFPETLAFKAKILHSVAWAVPDNLVAADLDKDGSVDLVEPCAFGDPGDGTGFCIRHAVSKFEFNGADPAVMKGLGYNLFFPWFNDPPPPKPISPKQPVDPKWICGRSGFTMTMRLGVDVYDFDQDGDLDVLVRWAPGRGEGYPVWSRPFFNQLLSP